MSGESRVISGWRVTLGLALLLSSWGVFAWGDSDGDGVPDNKDACPGTQTQMPVSANGCVLDKAFSLTDTCLPTTAAGAYPAGCGIAEPVRLYFDLGSAQIPLAQWPQLAKMKVFLEQYNVSLSIEGHTDISGSDAINQPLSAARAESARAILIKDYGFPAARFSTRGYGSKQPAADNTNVSGRSLNRRVEFVVDLPK